MATQRKTSGAKPTHRIYVVTGEGKSTSWTPIGAAWLHADGNGYSQQFDALPVGGRTVMRLITERPAQAEA